MLCKQILRAVSMALPGCWDSEIAEMTVLDVVPAGGSAHLIVQLSGTIESEDSIERLARAATWLRGEIAPAITRKKVPTLSLICVPAGGYLKGEST
jgi:ribosome-binding factor A